MTTKEIKITTTTKKTPFKNNFKYCVGTGRLGLALRKEYLNALTLAVKEIGFKYIRGHGLFHDDIGIYREYEWENEQKVIYNFTYIDQIFDSFLEIGIKPFIELGFMPNDLASGTQTVFWWKGNVTPPKDYKKWNDLVAATIKHFIDRYGLEEVKTWPIEVWNEPNLTNFWENADMLEYFKLYKETVQTIKAINSELLVGGPSICGGGENWMKEFIDFCTKENLPMDFLSRHSYTSGPAKLIPFACYQEIHPSENLLQDFKSGREATAGSKFATVPVHITEFNTSYKPVNPVHDTAFNAAYLGHVLAHGGDYVDSFSYWTFSDVFEEEDVPKALFHGGFGMLAYNCIKKPTYHLYHFFAKLKGDILHRDNDMIVVADNNNLFVVSYNPTPSSKTFKLSLPFSAKTAFVKRERVNEKYANARNAWCAMGRPRFPSKDQIRIIKEASHPETTTFNLSAVNEKVELEYRLDENEVSFFEIMPVHNEEQPYYGLDDSRILTG